MIAEIGFVVLHVADQARALHFYLYRLGFVEPPTPRPEGGLRATCVDPDGHRLVLVA